MRERLIKLSSKIMVLLLAFVMVFGFDSGVYAGPQEDLEKGMVELSNDDTLTFKAGETYIVALRGGQGGYGGSGYQVQYYTSEEQSAGSGYYYYIRSGGGGAQGVVNYYQITAQNDTTLNFYKGNNGGTGGNHDGAIYGGGGGRNSINLGNGGSGSNGNGPSYRHSGGGGGGGAASVITFNNDVELRLVANGAQGGSGASTYYRNRDGTYDYNYSGGSGGTGGTATQTLTEVPGLEIKVLSNAEGSAKVNTPSSGRVIIRKQRKATGDAIKVSDLMAGEHIVLTNSVDNASTIFQKTANDFEFKWLSGSTYYYTGGTGRPLDWSFFSKYVVSGSGSTSNIIVKVKKDLSFLGGDGSSIFPYYPEAAGSVSGGSGGSAIESFQNTETLSNSIISVSTQIETLLNYQKEKDELELNSTKSSNLPFTFSAKSLTGATATKSSTMPIILKINGRKSQELTYSVSINDGEESEPNFITSNNIITINGLVSGYNTIVIKVSDADNNYQIEVVNIWKI